MRIPHRDTARISSFRTLTEMRLSALLKRAGSAERLEAIKRLIFEESQDGLSPYVTKMLRLFESADVDGDIVLPVLQDAWNYFPHRSLNGQSPAERLLALQTRDVDREALLDQDDIPPVDQGSSDNPFEEDDIRMRETN
jgi:hypothetical protein